MSHRTTRPNILLIILARECRMRLRRPSFWVVTLLIPAVLALLYALPVWTAQRHTQRTTVLVVDETGLFADGLRSTLEVGFKPMPTLDYARREAAADRHGSTILFIPMRETTIPHDAFLYYFGTPPSADVQSQVDNQLQQLLHNAILEDVYGLDPEVFLSVEGTRIRLRTHEAATGKESFVQVRTVAAVALAVLMVVALLLFGVGAMRSVQEERQNRVAEVIASSVRPTALLVGKVAGIAATALLQLALWTALTAAAIGGIQAASPDLFAQARQQQQMHTLATKGAEATAQYSTPVHLVDETVQGLAALNLPVVVALFGLFFLLGLLLYGVLIAAVAARKEDDADAMQWTLLVGSPLLLALLLAPLVLRSPTGALAQWLSIVPFTAPAAMMLRLPFGIGAWQVWLAVLLLVGCIAAASLVASRAYRHHLVG